MCYRGGGLAAGKRQVAAVALLAAVWTPPSRGRGGARPRSSLARVEHGNPVRVQQVLVSRPQGRPKSLAGTGWSNKRMPVAERQQETGTVVLLLQRSVSDNWPDTGRDAR